MASLVELKSSIDGIRAIGRTTKAMRVLSLSLHSSLKGIVRRYEEIVAIIGELVDSDFGNSDNFLGGKTLFVFVGAHRGLCGSYVSDMAKKVFKLLEEDDSSIFYIIGERLMKKVRDRVFLSERRYRYMQFFKKEMVVDIGKDIQQYADAEGCSSIRFVYTMSRGISSRYIAEREFFLKKNSEKKFFEKYFSVIDENKEKSLSFFSRIKRNYEIKLLFYQSLLSEQAARFIAMDNAFRNAEKVIAERTIMYFKARQNRITEEILTLVGSL